MQGEMGGDGARNVIENIWFAGKSVMARRAIYSSHTEKVIKLGRLMERDWMWPERGAERSTEERRSQKKKEMGILIFFFKN